MTSLRRPLAAGAGTVLLLLGALVAAGAAGSTATAALLAAEAVVEAAVGAVAAEQLRLVRWVRRRLGAGDATTAAVRGVALVLLTARTAGTAQVCGAAALAVVTVATAVAVTGLDAVVRRERRPPVLTRNVALDAVAPRLSVPSAPTVAAALAALARGAAAVAAAGVAAGATGVGATAGLAAGAAVACLPLPLLGMQAARLRSRRVRAAVTSAGVDAMAALRPQLLLYFAATPGEVYQLDMWLRPVEEAGVPAAVVVRDPAVLAAVGTTSLPVFCVRHNGMMAALPLPDPTVALFVTHSGNNLSLLRRSEVRSAFVGHGDSDKPDSMNPYARVYDEVWVAGPVGRERYLQADVGVRPDALVEVGRPQLPAAWPDPPQPFTVLYAPTWEGWGDDEHHSSLPHAGPALVQQLLAGGVRVLYRPHPLTGVRNDAVRRAHAQVLALLRAAGAVEVGTDERPARSGGSDLLAAAVTSGRAPGRSRAQWEAEADAWADRVLASHGDRPLLLTGDPPTLHQTFRAAHVLVADVSSVASDWLATGRPYAMVDTRGLGGKEFRRRFPVAAGAVVAGPDLSGIDELWRDRRTPKAPGAALRRARQAVLGPDDPPAAFRAAVQTLLARSPRRR